MSKYHNIISKYNFRDVSLGLQKLRDFLLGRKHVLHARFPPLLSPRSIPPPDIPRGPEYKYANNYYHERSYTNSVLPPVIAPVAEGPAIKRDPTKKAEMGRGMKPDSVCFASVPTPGMTWWWDGHCYYERVVEPRSSQPAAAKSQCKGSITKPSK